MLRGGILPTLKEALIDASKIAELVVQNGLVGTRLHKTDTSNQIYRDKIRPEVDQFEVAYGMAPQRALQSVLDGYVGDKGLEGRYDTQGMYYFGQVMNPYTWAAITLKDAAITDLKVTYYPQLFILVNKLGVMFGFGFGTRVSPGSIAVIGVVIDSGLREEVIGRVAVGSMIRAYRYVDGSDGLKEEDIVPLQAGTFGQYWTNTTALLVGFRRDDIPNDIESQIKQAFDDLFPLFDHISTQRQLELYGRPAEGGPEPPQTPLPGGPSLDDISEETGYPLATLESWKAMLLDKRQIVFQGPPGTGKTYMAEQLARHLAHNEGGFYEVIQFHPAYSYEDFIQGLRPVTREGNLSFEMRKGKFLEFCERSAKSKVLSDGVGPERRAKCVLIIDEINRADLPRVFGELLYLLEYRDREIELAAGEIRFRIPENVLLIGTMNTADRSIALVDYALRRRFSFVTLQPEYDILREHLISEGYQPDDLIGLLEDLNEVINDPNLSIGISFFMNKGGRLKETLPLIWKGEIEPLLREYFFGQGDRMANFTWEVLRVGRLRAWSTG